MQYKGIELKEITEPQLFNPPKRMLAWDDDGECPTELNVCAIVNREGFRVITEGSAWRHCAEIPEEPKTLVTYRELSRWLAEGKGEVTEGSADSRGAGPYCSSKLDYSSSKSKEVVENYFRVRKWSDAEWHSPTRDYLGLEDK